MTIKDVKIKELKHLADDRGELMEILRSDDSIFKGFGQCYLTICNKGAVKGWHYHKEQTDNFVCVSGKALVVLYDYRKDSPTHGQVFKIILEEPSNGSKPVLLQIPPMIVHGFTAIDCEKTVILNVPDKVYIYDNPDEHRIQWNSKEVPFEWPESVVRGG
jgi:dTDP-4-dehydrorhamnose 3,5-epimerase